MSTHTPEPLTLQDLFNNAWRHAVIEKQPPSLDHWRCRYRGQNGTRCLIGTSIPDENYDSKCEGLLARSALSLLNIPITDEASKYVFDLQRCHDIVAESWTETEYTRNVGINLRAFASDHHLSIPEGGS